MPTFITKIYLQAADEKDHEVLTKELKKRLFTENNYKEEQLRTTESFADAVSFIRHGNTIQEVNNEVLKAARETGRPFSFTVIRNKN